MGVKHARRIEAEMYRLQEAHPELAEFFDQAREEQFFVKNLERVQGDERDAIILSVGYGKDSSGRLLNRFGPLNFEGGQRRLNVAVTRARQRLKVVSSFAQTDMDPARFNAEGVKLLRDYLEYAGSGGRILRASGATGEELNPFEADVFETLTANGMKLIPQWGTSRYRIDMVVQHPEEPGRFVLAIECDGASYHSAYTARDRDRLRQQQLEALGWRFVRIWSTDWFLRKAEEVQRVKEAYQKALLAPARDVVRLEPRDEVSSAVPPSARGPRPRVIQRSSITEYRMGELVSLVRWIESDGRVLTDEEIVSEMTRELGFSRRGARIEAAIRTAIRSVRSAERS
jgi:very-short-patch-repair endonuclease